MTADGAWLLISYAPISPSCTLPPKEQAACLEVAGDVDGAFRPGFTEFVTGRVQGSTIVNTCEALNATLDEAYMTANGLFMPPSLVYGFRRQADGTYAEPFPIGLKGTNGCSTPWGPEAHVTAGPSARFLGAWGDHRDWGQPANDDNPNLWAAESSLGEPVELGVWNGTAFDTLAMELISGQAFPGPTGNPHGFENGTGEISVLFWDSEHGAEDVFYRYLSPGASFPAGPFEAVGTVPVFADVGVHERMPFFDGTEMLVMRELDVVSSAFSGDPNADIGDPQHWGPIVTELKASQADDPQATEAGTVIALGEPSVARGADDEKRVLFFSYLVRGSNGRLDMNIGVVPER